MSARREAAKRLGIALQVRYRNMLEASGQDEIAAAAVELGQCFNDNIEAIIWFLRDYGGDKSQMPLEKR